jgi:hypothetical protein
MISGTINLYLNSKFDSTARKMAEMTPEQLDLADKIYAEAEKNYGNGGHWIVEAMEPWEVVKMFKNLAQAAQHWEMVEDYAQDIQNA